MCIRDRALGASGTVTITARAGSLDPVSVKITVALLPTSVSLPAAAEVVVGQTTRFTATISPAGAQPSSILWSVEPVTGAASVDESGNLTGEMAGQVRLVARTLNGRTASCLVEITNPVRAIVIDLSLIHIYIIGIRVHHRVANAVGLQELLTKFGCNIKLRVGLHETSEKFCADDGVITVSYTHLDVYKRQSSHRAVRPSARGMPLLSTMAACEQNRAVSSALRQPGVFLEGVNIPPPPCTA